MPKGGKPKQQKKRAEKAAQQKNKKAEREERKRRRKDRDRYTDDEDKRFAAQLAAAGLRVNEVDADGDRGREFSREMFETRPVVDLIRRLANDRAME